MIREATARADAALAGLPDQATAPEPTKEKYIVITAAGIDMFAAKCSAAMDEGYFPYGQPFIHNGVYNQAFLFHGNKIMRKMK